MFDRSFFCFYAFIDDFSQRILSIHTIFRLFVCLVEVLLPTKEPHYPSISLETL